MNAQSGSGNEARDVERDPGPLRILITFPYALGRVGVGQTALQQANGLARLGHSVEVAAPILASGAQLEPAITLHATRQLMGRQLPARLFRSTPWRLGWHDLRTAWLLASAPESDRFDIVHSWPLSGVRTMRLAHARLIPVAREVPNTHTENAYDAVERESKALGLTVSEVNSHRRNFTNLEMERREWAEADAILCPSEPSRRSFIDRGFDPRRLVRHRYGCVLPAEPQPHRPDRPFTAVFLGRAEPRKGLHLALQAWLASLASESGRFLIYGNFEDGYREVLQRQLSHPSVEVLGFTDNPLRVLADSDVLLLPSVEEGSAIVTYEAQSVGSVPLVSTAAGAFLEDGVHGLVHATHDVATLTAQLDSLVSDPQLLAALRAACIAHRPELSWDAAARSLESAYRRIIALATTRHMTT